jgi:hypothetical protein
MVVFEALSAKFGDSLILRFPEGNGSEERLWVIDGGPAGVWNGALRRRLEEILEERGSDVLTIDAVMLSHVDDDHVNGILQMTRGLLRQRDQGEVPWLDIRRFWHNSFSDLIGSEAALSAAQASLAAHAGALAAASREEDAGGGHRVEVTKQSPLIIDGVRLETQREALAMASINQGRQLRDHITRLGLPGNDPFGGLIESGKTREIDGASVKVVSPLAGRLAALRQQWAAAAAAASPAALAELFRDDLDESVTNLSSVVALVTIQGCTILLTGDARGDDVVTGFEDAGIQLPFAVDILKMPHHGSDRNMTEAFLRSFPARHYVISADGHHGNPDDITLRAIVAVRGDDEYTIHLTNEVGNQAQLLEELNEGKRFDWVYRDPDALGLVIELPT